MKDVTLEEAEIIADLIITIDGIKEMAIDSAGVEEDHLDPTLQEALDQQDRATTMISEDQEETDLDLVAEMDLHTVENGIERGTDILSEEA